MRPRLTAVLLLSAFAALAQQPPAGFHEEVEVRVMDLDVAVTDSQGRPVPDLKREDFTVKTLERAARSDPASYVLELSQPSKSLPLNSETKPSFFSSPLNVCASAARSNAATSALPPSR